MGDGLTELSWQLFLELVGEGSCNYRYQDRPKGISQVCLPAQEEGEGTKAY